MPRFIVKKLEAIEFLNKIPDEQIDLIITDPPYESLERWRAQGTTTRLKHSTQSSNNWFNVFPNERFPELFSALYRVLKPNSHLYLFCDATTMWVAKPMAEEAGFKFHKPVVWDKCLDPTTPIATSLGVRLLGSIRKGEDIYTPNHGLVNVRGVRRVKAPTVCLILSDGSKLTAARKHLLLLSSGQSVEAGQILTGAVLATASICGASCNNVLKTVNLIPLEDQIVQLPPNNFCLWCGADFNSNRSASAHQSRFCTLARSKKSMAAELGISRKRLSWWLGKRMIPAIWANTLGLNDKVTGRIRAMYQNDTALTFPEEVKLDYALGKLVGLYAAQGSMSGAMVTFAFHPGKRDSHYHVARYVRTLGMRASIKQTSENGVVVTVGFKFAQQLIKYFVGGTNAPTKYLKETVYTAPAEFRAGVFDGLNDGDGCWEWKCQRDRYCSTSIDLVMFVLRYAREQGWSTKIRRIENEYLGAWYVGFDRSQTHKGLQVLSITDAGKCELVDIAIDTPHLFLLGNGIVTHNCTIGMGYHYRAQYEFILFFEKGKRKLNNLGVPDVLSFRRLKGKAYYPTEKPVDLLKVLVEQSSVTGEVVLDPFAGSGSTGEAAITLGRRFVGNDASATAYERMRSRLLQVGGGER